MANRESEIKLCTIPSKSIKKWRNARHLMANRPSEGVVGRFKNSRPRKSHGEAMVEFRCLVCHQLDADCQKRFAVDASVKFRSDFYVLLMENRPSN